MRRVEFQESHSKGEINAETAVARLIRNFPANRGDCLALVRCRVRLYSPRFHCYKTFMATIPDLKLLRIMGPPRVSAKAAWLAAQPAGTDSLNSTARLGPREQA